MMAKLSKKAGRKAQSRKRHRGPYQQLELDFGIYLPIKGYEGLYSVSDDGRIRSLPRTINDGKGGSRRLRERMLKQYSNGRGYLIAKLHINGKGRSHKVHRLVYESHKGILIDSLLVDHINNIRTDNNSSNLQQITNRENCSKDQFRHNRSSQFIGVSWNKKNKCWEGYISFKGINYHLGYYDREIIAALAYRQSLKSMKPVRCRAFKQQSRLIKFLQHRKQQILSNGLPKAMPTGSSNKKRGVI